MLSKLVKVFKALFPKQKTARWPDGMTLASWKHGKSLAWDFTCVDTLADSHIHLTSKGPGKAAEKAEKGKIAKYEDLTHNFIVQPVAAETLGAWHKIY